MFARWPSFKAWQQGEGVGPAVLQDLSALAMLCLGTAACGLSLRYLGLKAKLWADGCTHDEPSRLITWAMMLSAILCIATASVSV